MISRIPGTASVAAGTLQISTPPSRSTSIEPRSSCCSSKATVGESLDTGAAPLPLEPPDDGGGAIGAAPSSTAVPRGAGGRSLEVGSGVGLGAGEEGGLVGSGPGTGDWPTDGSGTGSEGSGTGSGRGVGVEVGFGVGFGVGREVGLGVGGGVGRMGGSTTT